jgi:hypothetical protein
MITRHPIDVLRLSDFSDMKYSCWSEGGAYGHCSQDEALEGGPVAFLVPKEEIEKVSLQDLHGMEEVFSDTDIGSEGKTTAEPSSRLRLISLKTFEADELAVPAAKGLWHRCSGLQKYSQRLRLECPERHHRS